MPALFFIARRPFASPSLPGADGAGRRGEADPDRVLIWGEEMVELTSRLRTVGEWVPRGSRFADIGTDHAYLPVWLILHGRIEGAIAADLRSGPLERARQTARRYGVEERVDFRLCDGLEGVGPREAEVIAIAGMGGETIAHILSAAPWTGEGGRTLLLQPMTGQPELRRWLGGAGYSIDGERICREGKRLYSIWRVRGGDMPPHSPGELWAGRQSPDPLRGEYLDYIAAKAGRALAGHRAAARPDRAAVADLEAVLQDLMRMKEEWSAWRSQ